MILLKKILMYYNVYGDTMSDLLVPFFEFSISFLQNFGFIAGFLLICLESILPILPLGLFVAFNFSAYGIIVGFVISYLATICGCVLAYYMSKKLLGFYVHKKTLEYERFKLLTIKFKKIKFSSLVLLTALPFSPAFLINIAAGVVKMDLKKFIFSLLISKVSIVYFWGMVGKSFIESIGDLKAMLFLFISLIICYILSKFVSKKMNME